MEISKTYVVNFFLLVENQKPGQTGMRVDESWQSHVSYLDALDAFQTQSCILLK